MNIIVTGASKGIGFELVKQFGSEGEHTIFAVARNAEQLNILKQDCIKHNSKTTVIPIACDLSNVNERAAAILEIKKNTTSIDVLINNAGMLVKKSFEELKMEEVQKIYSVNIFSVIALIQELLPILKKSLQAHVVNISSIGGFQGSSKFSGLSAYSSSKAALACLTECLAEEYKNSNVKFNALALGSVQTEMLEEAFPGYKAPLTAKQMAEYIAHFSFTANKFMNGKIIPVSLNNP